MLYTPRYVQNNDLDKTICKCAECKKYRVLYCHSNIVENKDDKLKIIESYIIASCSKCKRIYRFELKYKLEDNKEDYKVGKIREIEEKYNDVRENIQRNYNSYEQIYTIKSENFFTKVIKESNDNDLSTTEYVFMEK